MRHLVLCAICRRILVCSFFCISISVSAQPNATEIITKADQLLRGKTQQGRYLMKIVRPDWERSLRFDFWAEGTEKSLVRVLEPAKNRGVGFLKIDREMWNYVPRINKVIKIPPSMMLQSWMGSDFTNDDLVKESSIVKDYTHTLIGRDTLDGFPVYLIQLVPKPEAAVTWDRLVEWIREADYLPLKTEYFNERGERIRTMSFTGIKKMGGRVIPSIMSLSEEKKPGQITTLVIEKMLFDRPIPKRIFTQQNLRKR